MKKDLKTRLTSRKTPKPNIFLMSFFMFWIGILNKIYKVKIIAPYLDGVMGEIVKGE